MTSKLQRTLLREIAGARLTPSATYVPYVRARMYHWGDVEARRLQDIALPKDAARLLGFGHVMAEFATAQLGIGRRPAAAVLSLGALSNLIVSTYDGLIDSGSNSAAVLSRSQASGIQTGDTPVARLVARYFSDVAALPHRHAPVLQALRRAILRMYDAERATAESRGFSAVVWRRKSALPLVVLGLPVWMTAPSFDAAAYCAHVRWLYRLGRFFGWLDDAADCNDDRSAGRPNYFVRDLADRREARMARRIAAEGVQILRAWDAGAPHDAYGRTLRETFLAITRSWVAPPAGKTGTQ